jgi:indole-3-acetate monooxygenase
MKQMHQKEKTMRMINEEITTNKITSDLLDAVEEIRPVIETGAPRAEADRKLPQEVFDAMYDAGLFGLLAPKAYGGLELPLPEVMRVWEAVAHIDSAAGWNLVMNQGLASFIAWLPNDGAEELMADGPATVAGGFFPPGTAKRAEGGWEVTARVPFASGCHNAKWHWLPALETEDGEPVMDPESGEPIVYGFFVPGKKDHITDTWHTVGMRGTGSADIGISDYFVPDQRSMRMGRLQTAATGFEGPLYRMFPLSAVVGETIVSLGVASAAIDAILELIRIKTPAFTETPLRDQPIAQHTIGRAASNVNAGRDTLYAAAGEAYDELEASGELLSWDAKLRLQLAINFTVGACTDAVNLVHQTAGSSAIRHEQPFERLFRDAHTLTQHASKNSARHVSTGRLLFGLENDWTALAF